MGNARSDFEDVKKVKFQRQADMSKIVSQLWKGLSEEERAVWEGKAATIKREHEAKHPNYQYHPGRRELLDSSNHPSSSKPKVACSRKSKVQEPIAAPLVEAVKHEEALLVLHNNGPHPAWVVNDTLDHSQPGLGFPYFHTHPPTNLLPLPNHFSTSFSLNTAGTLFPSVREIQLTRRRSSHCSFGIQGEPRLEEMLYLEDLPSVRVDSAPSWGEQSFHFPADTRPYSGVDSSPMSLAPSVLSAPSPATTISPLLLDSNSFEENEGEKGKWVDREVLGHLEGISGSSFQYAEGQPLVLDPQQLPDLSSYTWGTTDWGLWLPFDTGGGTSGGQLQNGRHHQRDNFAYSPTLP
jgi:hypothetical protein